MVGLESQDAVVIERLAIVAETLMVLTDTQRREFLLGVTSLFAEDDTLEVLVETHRYLCDKLRSQKCCGGACRGR